MKRAITVGALVAMFLVTGTAEAQHSGPGHGAPAGSPAAPPAGPPPHGSGTPAHMPMAMCTDMMRSGGMGMGPMGMPAAGDPATAAQMMEMRGEMMKAMGEVMMKHAQKMRGTQTPPKN